MAFFSTWSSILEVSFLVTEKEVIKLRKNETFNKLVRERLFSIDDRLKTFFQKNEDLLFSVVCYKQGEKREPTYLFCPELQTVVINLDENFSNVRQYTVVGLLIPKVLKVEILKPSKAISRIPTFANSLARIFYIINRRPLEQEQFVQEAFIWFICHYLRIARQQQVNFQEVASFVSTRLPISYFIRDQIRNIVSDINSKGVYSSRVFLVSTAESLFQSTYDMILSSLLSRFGSDIIAALDEPFYLVTKVFLDNMFGINNTHTYVDKSSLSAFNSIFLTSQVIV
jgi:hypothetical protein